MAVEFLDDPTVSGATKPAGSAAPGGVEWIDAPENSPTLNPHPSTMLPGVEFVDDKASPADPAEIARRFLDPEYQPTLAEFTAYDKARKQRSIGQHVSDDLSLVGDAVSGLWDTVFGAVKALPKMARDPETNDPILTTVEAVKRGTMRDLDLAKKLLPSEMFGGVGLNFDQFAAVKLAQLNDQKFRYHPLTPENAHTLLTRDDVPPEVMSQWRSEYDNQFKPQAAYDAFLAKRQATRDEIAAARAVPGSGVNTEMAEALSLVASPSSLVPFGKALTPAKTLSRAIAAKTLEGAGKTFEWVGEKTLQASKLPERAAAGLTRAVSGSEEAAAAAENLVKRGSVGATLVSPVIAVPGLTETAAAITAGKITGKTLEAGGEAAQAAGRSVAQGPSRYGLFDRIRFDGQAPDWMRRAANAARGLDPAISLAGTAAKGAAEGAAIGAGLGGLAEGEEGAASGAGAGLMMGGGGALLGRMVARGSYRAGLEDLDVARWLASKSPDEVRNLRSLNLSRDQAVQLADVERLARGVVEPGRVGDVEFRYVNDQQFREQFGGIAKGAQILEGDRPVVVVNTSYRGPRSVFHEISHALDALDAFSPQRQKLNRLLFDQTTSDGTVLTRGLYTADDLAEFSSQYRSRLPEAAKAEWDLLPPDVRQQRILSEVRAESFANLLGSGADPLPLRSLRRRVADKLLLADQPTFLGKLRSGLESMGVQFNAAGAPSELFARNGRPVTNTPAVDAALRDYLRAKDQISRRLSAGSEESPDLIIQPQDLANPKNRSIVEAYKDNDAFAKNPDGSVKIVGGEETVRRAEASAAKAIDAARQQESLAAEAARTAAEAERLAQSAEVAAKQAQDQAARSKSREDIANAKAAAVRWREARRRGETFLREARAKDKAAKAQAQAARQAQDAAQNAKFSAGVPVLLSEREIRAVQSRRVDAMVAALDTVPDEGAAGAVRKKPNGAFEGKAFSDRQLAALDALPDDILSPSMKSKLRELNSLAQQDGAQIILDYNAALKGGKYSSGIAPTTRAAVPIAFHISQAGNFYLTTLDTSQLFRKLGDWRKALPKAFAPWNGDPDAFLRDMATYLDNHRNGRRGSVDLDSDPAKAELKKNTINSFFNISSGEDMNPIQLNRPGDKDRLIRARRFDRINRVTPGAGDKFPIRYELQKQNFLPAGSSDVVPPPSPGGEGRGEGERDLRTADLSPRQVQKHISAQAHADLSRKVPAPPHIAEWMATTYLDKLDAAVNRGSKENRTEQLRRFSAIASTTSPRSMRSALQVMLSAGREGAAAALSRTASLKALAAK